MDDHQQPPPIFVCYDRKDADFAIWLSQALKDLGHTIWLDVADMLGGVQTYEMIQQALDRARVMLLVITPESMRSRFVSNQWMYFVGESANRIIPILLEPLTPPAKLNFMLAALQHIDFHRQDRKSALGILHATLQDTYADLNHTPTAFSEPFLPGSPVPRRWKLEDRLSAAEAGVASVHLNMPYDLFRDWLSGAREKVRILNTWTWMFVEYEELLASAIRRGVVVQILLLNPSSPFSRQRSLDLRMADPGTPIEVAAEEVPQYIRASIRQIAGLYPELEGLPGKLTLRLYDMLPSISVHQCDDRALVGFFPHSAHTIAFPLLEVDMNTPFGGYVDDEFGQIGDDATPVDLAPRFAPDIEAANLALPEPLSARELEILTLIGVGLSNQEIANRLVLAMATVKKHINNLYSKLGVDSRTRAILHAQNVGLLKAAHSEQIETGTDAPA